MITKSKEQKESPRQAGQGDSRQIVHLAKDHSSDNVKAGFGLLQDKKPSMRQVLKTLGVSYTEKKVTSWQNVMCPICSHEKARAVIHGKFGPSGGYFCGYCGCRGDALYLYRRATQMGFREACSAFGAWGLVGHD